MKMFERAQRIWRVMMIWGVVSLRDLVVDRERKMIGYLAESHQFSWYRSVGRLIQRCDQES